MYIRCDSNPTHRHVEGQTRTRSAPRVDRSSSTAGCGENSANLSAVSLDAASPHTPIHIQLRRAPCSLELALEILARRHFGGLNLPVSKPSHNSSVTTATSRHDDKSGSQGHTQAIPTCAVRTLRKRYGTSCSLGSCLPGNGFRLVESVV